MNELIEQLQRMLEAAEIEHEDAEGIETTAYWQGRKDGLRVALSILTSDHGYAQLIQSSSYAYKQSVKEFEPADATELKGAGECIECAQLYFHTAGCQHGAGLSDAELTERMAYYVDRC